jgi:uncharacterized protein YbjQ (UPF0145 family)
MEPAMSGDGSFTSQLSVDGFALCEPAGVAPLRQVMGSSVFYLGSPSYHASARLSRHHGRVRGAELTGVSKGFAEARAQALDRVRSQAHGCGAHAVLDVRVRREHCDSQAQSVEYVISGTAVRLTDGSRPPAEPTVVALAMDDYWKLLQAGYEPVGIAAASVVYETAPSVDAVRALAGMRYAEGRATREVPEFSDTVSGTIELALARAGESVQRWHADHIVGVQIEHKLELVDRENTGRMPLTREPAKRRDLRVTVHLLGSAIRDRGAEHGRERTARGTWREIGQALAPSKPVIELNATDALSRLPASPS